MDNTALRIWLDDEVVWSVVINLKPDKFDALCTKLALEYCEQTGREDLAFNYLRGVIRNLIIEGIRKGKHKESSYSIHMATKAAKAKAASRGGAF